MREDKRWGLILIFNFPYGKSPIPNLPSFREGEFFLPARED